MLCIEPTTCKLRRSLYGLTIRFARHTSIQLRTCSRRCKCVLWRYASTIFESCVRFLSVNGTNWRSITLLGIFCHCQHQQHCCDESTYRYRDEYCLISKDWGWIVSIDCMICCCLQCYRYRAIRSLMFNRMSILKGYIMVGRKQDAYIYIYIYTFTSAMNKLQKWL